MTINKELLDLIEESGLDPQKALTYCIAIAFKDQINILPVLMQSGILSELDIKTLRIRFTDMDISGYTLKVPLLQNETNSERFDEFWRMFRGKDNVYGITAIGHSSNPLPYSPFPKSEKLKEVFSIINSKMDIDLDRMCSTISKYYRTVEMPKKLENYLMELFEDDYLSYQEEIEFNQML